MSHSTLAILIVGIAAVWLYLKLRRHFAARRIPYWLPRELRSAELVSSEVKIVAFAPARIAGVPDREYKTRDGHHIPLEFKRRSKPRAYLSDVIQLSTYRMIRAANASKVADHGYVVVIDPTTREKTPIRVALLQNEVMMRLLDRYLGIKRGQINPTRTPHKSLCRQCEYKPECEALTTRSMQPQKGKQ